MPLDVKRSWFCNAFFLVFTALLAFVLFPDRSKQFDYDLFDQNVLDSDVPLSRHRDPLRMKVDRAILPDIVELGPTTDAFSNQEARVFIDSHLLPLYDTPTSEEAKRFYSALQTRQLTPLHATMMLMGCYGYIYGDKQHEHQGSTSHYLSKQSLWRDYTTPFMLQALEDRVTGPGRDKSVCSCMKDFGSPTLVSLQDDEKALEKNVQDKLLDTCSLQNTIDYALQAPSANVLDAQASKNDVSKSVLLLPMEAANLSRRQRKDGLAIMLENANTANPTGNPDSNNIEFLTAYCELSPDACTGLPAAVNAITNAQLWVFLQNRVDSVKAHNKLRPPKLCTGTDGSSAKCNANLKQDTSPSVSAATYNAYIEKYRHAFDMCSRAGVPQYTTLRVGRMRPHRVYNIGQCFLFLAALFAYTWSIIIAHYIDKYKVEALEDQRGVANNNVSDKDLSNLLWEKSKYRWMLLGGTIAVAVAWIFLLVALVRGWFWNGSDDDAKHQEGQIPHETDGASTFFIVFFWLVSIVFLVVFMYLQTKFWEISRTHVYDFLNKGREFQSHSALVSGVPMLTRLGVSDEFVQRFNNVITARLQSLAPYAQIALDLSIIAGLTTLAVANVAQRGVQDINVITGVSVWFLAIGLFAHLSNMLRLVHVYVQFHAKAYYSKHVQKAAHHRLYLAVLLALMLFAYTTFAGVDSGSTAASHPVLHQLLFAVVTLLVLCGSDIVEHMAASPSLDSDDNKTTERFWQYMANKNYYLAWILLLALVFLHMHRAVGICEASKGTMSTGNCLFLSK